jgi:hypothetical protein
MQQCLRPGGWSAIEFGVEPTKSAVIDANVVAFLFVQRTLPERLSSGLIVLLLVAR